MSVLHLDLESRSVVDLTRTGVYVYAADPTTDIWVACFAFDDGPVQVWRPGQPCPDAIIDHVLDGGEIYAHNANFERTMWARILGPRYHWPVPATTQWRCTMVMAYALALSGSLGDAAPAVGLEIRKDMAGRRLMLQMAKPRSTNPIVWWDDEQKIQRLIAYCVTDVEVERALHKRLRPLKPSELDLWHLDCKINDKGVYADVDLSIAAHSVVRQAEEAYDRKMLELTDKDVSSCSNRNQLIAWLGRHGLVTDTVAKEWVEEILATDIPPIVREVLELRRASAKASVAKIDALQRGMDKDRRVRGLLQFHGAGTGRWAGRGFQPQNLPRPDGMDLDEVQAATGLMGEGRYDLLSMIYDEPLSIVGVCLRGLIAAAPGRRIVAADYSNIEGRVLAWLAGESWKLDAFRDADAGRAPDVYIQSYCRAFGVPFFPKSDPRRKSGKTMELASGFGGGHGAYIRFGVSGTLADSLVKLVRSATTPDVWGAANERYTPGFDLTRDQWTALRVTIDKWRAAHPRIKDFWTNIEDAAIQATDNPGTVHPVGPHIRFKKAGSFLFMRLPSGRFLSYPYPQVMRLPTPWKDNDGNKVYKDALTFMSVITDANRSKKVDPKEPGKWCRISAYGGLLAENATQAVARDVMADGMPRIEAAGYPIILTVHDELVTEPLIGHGSLKELCDLMVPDAEWARGLPVSVAGFEAERYGKGE